VRDQNVNDLSVDVPYKWLEFFLDDDAEFDRIGKEYGTVAAEPAPEPTAPA
jgi:hypothetical protein